MPEESLFKPPLFADPNVNPTKPHRSDLGGEPADRCTSLEPLWHEGLAYETERCTFAATIDHFTGATVHHARSETEYGDPPVGTGA